MNWFKKAQIKEYNIPVILTGVLYSKLRSTQKEYIVYKTIHPDDDFPSIYQKKNEIKEIIYNFSLVHELNWSDRFCEELAFSVFWTDGENFDDISREIKRMIKIYKEYPDNFDN